MQTPSTLSIWLSEQALPLALIAAAVALILIVLAASAQSRRRRMNQVRHDVTEQSFVKELAVFGFDAQISGTTYRYLQDSQNIYFPIEASDLLDEDLGLDHEDLHQTIQDLLRLNSRLYMPGLKHTPLVDVEDLVRFIQASPRISNVAA